MKNGQAFILHIWNDLDCKVDTESDNWSDGWALINYLTHDVSPMTRNLNSKLEWLQYIDSF